MKELTNEKILPWHVVDTQSLEFLNQDWVSPFKIYLASNSGPDVSRYLACAVSEARVNE